MKRILASLAVAGLLTVGSAGLADAKPVHHEQLASTNSLYWDD